MATSSEPPRINSKGMLFEDAVIARLVLYFDAFS
jgi:hypothetical protein